MNGRMYDPAVGRFLSADPVVQDAGNSQNYNRYSYCLNNPLKYTDPSGYILEQQDFLPDPEQQAAGEEFFRKFSGSNNGNGGIGGWYTAYRQALNKGYTGDLVKFMGIYDDQFFSPNFNGSLTYTYYTTSYRNCDEPGFLPSVSIVKTRHDLIINIPEQGGRHSTANDLWNITMGGAGTLADIVSNGLHNSIYWVQKNGKFTLTENIGNNYLLQRSNKIVGEALLSGKMIANSLTQVNITYSAADYALTWAIKGLPTFGQGMDLFFTSVAAIPGAGWAASGGYWIISSGSYAITGKWMSEHMDNWVFKILKSSICLIIYITGLLIIISNLKKVANTFSWVLLLFQYCNF